jgi:hypothetical protein
MKINNPIQFPVLVNGVRKTAFMDEQIGRGAQSILHIYFSDGFEDYFYFPENGGLYGSKPDVQPYEKSLRNDGNILTAINPNRFYHIFQENIDNVMTNIWILEHESVPGMISYAVYFNNAYRFEVMKVKYKWVTFTRSLFNKEIDPFLSKRVRETLDLVLG